MKLREVIKHVRYLSMDKKATINVDMKGCMLKNWKFCPEADLGPPPAQIAAKITRFGPFRVHRGPQLHHLYPIGCIFT